MSHKGSKEYSYRICGQYHLENEDEFIFLIQDSETLSVQKMTILQLVNFGDLLSKFHPEDIFLVGYIAGQQQLRRIKKWIAEHP